MMGGAVEAEPAGGMPRPLEAAEADGLRKESAFDTSLGLHQSRQRIAQMKRMRVIMVCV